MTAKRRLHRSISNVTAVIIILAILFLGIATSLTLLNLGHGPGTTSTTSSLTATTTGSIKNSSAPSSANGSSSVTTSIVSTQSNSTVSSASSSSRSTVATSSSTSASSTTSQSVSSTPTIVYIPTNNSPDLYGENATFSLLNTNTGQGGWVYETSQNDSLYFVTNNQLTLIQNQMRYAPTGATFDSTNNIAYMTGAIPFASAPKTLFAVFGNAIINTPVTANLKSSPQTLTYDQHYNYLYVSVQPQAMSTDTQVGVEVFNPDNGTLLYYIPTGAQAPTEFAYDSTNGIMFAAINQFGNNNAGTIDVINGSSITSSFNDRGGITSMLYDPADGYLYVAHGNNGGITVWNTSSSQLVGTINSSPISTMVYDSQNGITYAFTAPSSSQSGQQILAIKGNSVVSTQDTSHVVTSALYDTQYNNILAFY